MAGKHCTPTTGGNLNCNKCAKLCFSMTGLHSQERSHRRRDAHPSHGRENPSPEVQLDGAKIGSLLYWLKVAVNISKLKSV